MSALAILIPVALFLGGIGLIGFYWSMRSGQFEDLDGASMRILIDDQDAITPDDDKKQAQTLSEESDPSEPRETLKKL
jgi:cbb3-type cytochrome oxidase maturation protein